MNRESQAERAVYSVSVKSLLKEYRLIQQKKSSLTKRQRDIVVQRVMGLAEKAIENKEGK